MNKEPRPNQSEQPRGDETHVLVCPYCREHKAVNVQDLQQPDLSCDQCGASLGEEAMKICSQAGRSPEQKQSLLNWTKSEIGFIGTIGTMIFLANSYYVLFSEQFSTEDWNIFLAAVYAIAFIGSSLHLVLHENLRERTSAFVPPLVSISFLPLAIVFRSEILNENIQVPIPAATLVAALLFFIGACVEHLQASINPSPVVEETPSSNTSSADPSQ